MARALTGYGEYHGLAEYRAHRVPRSHPEKMALAAGVLLDIKKPDIEHDDDIDSDQDATSRQMGSKALQGMIG